MMDGPDDFAMAMAIGLPIVLVAAAACYLALTGERPASRGRDAGLPAVPAEDDASEVAAGPPNR